ncbi:tetratricopeptide repeat protein [Tenacibaculum amylolyticum]|uniref:tetratricopeptide repeat protein n=1 Tax=Tenacibaculum amylolyticum TaxID=104269 RepID=UPI0038943055
MNVRIYLYYIALFSITVSFGQTKVKDSIQFRLEQEVVKATSDSTKVNAYLALGDYFLTRSFAEAEDVYKQAKRHLEKSSTILPKQKANMYGQLGVIYKRKGLYPKAMEYYLKSKVLFENLKDSSNIANLDHNIAMIYRSQGEDRRAIKVFKNVAAIKHKIGDKKGEGIAYNMMGVSFRKLKQLDSALVYYKKAEKLFFEANALDQIPSVNSNLATLYYYQKEYKKSIGLHKLNIAYKKKENKLGSLNRSHYNISKNYSLLKDYKKGLKHIDTAITLARSLGLKADLSKAYLRRSWILGKMGDYKNAFKYHRLHKKISDSLYNKTNVKKLQELELTYKFNKQKLADSLNYIAEKKELELVKAKEQMQKQLYFVLFIVAVLLGILVNILLRKYYQKQREAITADFEKKEAELKSLANQLVQKIEKQEKLLKKKKQEKEENTRTKKLHVTVSEKILTKDDWYNFRQKFNQVYPLFFKKIKEKGIKLTNSEERLVSLEKIGLDNNQIAKVLGISTDSVFVNRYRLRKKINAPKEISIVQFLETIDSK